MKLSEKGYLKIGNSIVGWLEDGVVKVTFDPDKIEFEPDDFEGGCCQNGKGHLVCLTLDEAKKILDALDWVDGYMYCNVYEKDIEAFKKKIEQAEKGHE